MLLLVHCFLRLYHVWGRLLVISCGIPGSLSPFRCTSSTWLTASSWESSRPGWKWRFPARHGGTPINGWFLLGKIPPRNGWFWGYPYFRKPPHDLQQTWVNCERLINLFADFWRLATLGEWAESWVLQGLDSEVLQYPGRRWFQPFPQIVAKRFIFRQGKQMSVFQEIT